MLQQLDCSIILSYCWWKKSCTGWDDRYPVIYRVLYIPGGAGFLPSTVSPYRPVMYRAPPISLGFFSTCNLIPRCMVWNPKCASNGWAKHCNVAGGPHFSLVRVRSGQVSNRYANWPWMKVYVMSYSRCTIISESVLLIQFRSAEKSMVNPSLLSRRLNVASMQQTCQQKHMA